MREYSRDVSLCVTAATEDPGSVLDCCAVATVWNLILVVSVHSVVSYVGALITLASPYSIVGEAVHTSKDGGVDAASRDVVLC